MANEEHLEILLNDGVPSWNRWRDQNPHIIPDLSSANLRWAPLQNANLWKANLEGAQLEGAQLDEASLGWADLRNAHLNGAGLMFAVLGKARLENACLENAHLMYANLSEANLSGADLTKATLEYAILADTNITDAIITGCRIFGISTWNLQGEPKNQSNLIITRPYHPHYEPTVTVDNLEVAQFIYSIRTNEKLRNVLNVITSKAVLILGNFARMEILNAIKDELTQGDYLPIKFTFPKPNQRDLTDTVKTLAHLSRFIIADITASCNVAHELASFVPSLAVPVQRVLLYSDRGYSMSDDLEKYQWVVPVYRYKTVEDLCEALRTMLIPTLNEKILEKKKR